MSVPEKRAVIDPDHGSLSVSRQCELIGLPRVSFYRHSSHAESSENLELMRLIDEEYTRHPFYGTRKMTIFLHRLGHAVNRKRVPPLNRRHPAP